MATPKLLTALNLISDHEWSSYKKYLLQQTQKNSKTFQLCKQLYAQRHQLLKEDFDKVLHKKHYSELTSKAFRNLLSKLYSSFEEWLAMTTFFEQKHNKERMLVKAYNQRGFYTEADRISKKLSAAQDTAGLSIENLRLEKELLHYQYFSNNPIKNKGGNELYNNLIASYLKLVKCEVLLYQLEQQNKSKVWGDKMKYQETLPPLAKHGIQCDLGEILQLAVDLQSDCNAKSLEKLTFILESGAIASTEDLHTILAIHLSRSATLLWKESKITSEIFVRIVALQLHALSDSKHQKLLPVTFFNTVNQIIVLNNDKQAATRLIEDWIDKVHTKYRDSCYKYCQAIIAFRLGEYEKLPGLLMGLQFDNNHYHYISSAQLIVAHYKLGSEDLTLQLMENLKKQMRRNKAKIAQNIFYGLKNLLDIISTLIKREYKKDITIDLSKYTTIFFRTWVEAELERRRLTAKI